MSLNETGCVDTLQVDVGEGNRSSTIGSRGNIDDPRVECGRAGCYQDGSKELEEEEMAEMVRANWVPNPLIVAPSGGFRITC